MSWFPQSPVTPDCPAAALEASLRAAAPGQPGGGGTRRLEILDETCKSYFFSDYLQQDEVILLVTIVPLSVRGFKYPICSTYLILLIVFPC